MAVVIAAPRKQGRGERAPRMPELAGPLSNPMRTCQKGCVDAQTASEAREWDSKSDTDKRQQHRQRMRKS
eukprot:2630804-Rhodomonas_salina.13